MTNFGQGMMIVLSSPSGAGKTTLTRMLSEKNDNFVISVSHTTRTPRHNEVNGKDYFFINKDKFQELEMNRLLAASINFYENESVTIDKIETGLSVAFLRDRLNKYIYSQTIDDLEYVDETVEIISGHVPITYNAKVASIIRFFQKDA